MFNLLYHYTRLDLVLNILNDNKLNTNYGFVSFTRDKYFHNKDVTYLVEKNVDLKYNKALFKWKYSIFARLVLNKDRLSNNYKIVPVNIFGNLDNNKELLSSTPLLAEERVFETIKHLDRYLLRIEFNRLIRDELYNDKMDYYFIDDSGHDVPSKGWTIFDSTPYEAANLLLKYFKGISLDDYFNLLVDKGINFDYFDSSLYN